MTNDADEKDEALLTQATEALRGTQTSAGPSPTLVMRTLAVLPAKEVPSRPSYLKRIRNMSWKKKALLVSGAAAAVVACSQVVFVGAAFALEHVEEDNWFFGFLHHIVMIHHHILGN